MTDTPSFREDLISQIPALQLLQALGYTYLTPQEALVVRGGKLSNVLLEDILAQQLRAFNRIQYKGRTLAFSDANIAEAIRRLKNEPFDGLVRTSEKRYELLTLGTSLQQTIDGDTRSFTLQYIDWRHPERNVYHITDEFSVERRQSHETRRPDIVLFVNGIPLVVIECKRPDLEKTAGEKAVTEAITQTIRNQKDDEIPELFTYSQLLLAVSKNDALYATTGTPRKFWSVWMEGAEDEVTIHRLINLPLSAAEKDHVYAHRDEAAAVRRYFDALEAAGDRLPTAQDRTLYSLLRPARLLELAYQYIVYDAGEKKIARYQQYFAIRATMARVEHLNAQGQRTGGVVWHTTGSGKSLTMVMLAKALALHPTITNPRIILVTDRVDLDEQIWRTFKNCGKSVHQAASGADLVKAVRAGKADVITTVINKFERGAGEGFRDPDPNIFVLVDESHRSQYGSFHAKMRQIFPNACYIGFTGTPLTKGEKATVAKFGSFIHTYPMQQAVADGAVVPLLYEGRMAELGVNQTQIDQWFERVTRTLSDDQKRDLKRKFSRAEAVSRTEQRIQQIAYDITEHYTANFQGSGLKAQLAAASKETAILYKKYLDEFGGVSSEVVISPPDTREGNEEVDNTTAPPVEAFWKRMMERFGTEDEYMKAIKGSFSRADGVEIIIVVDKLLTGFDEPRNTVLYIDKPLREHSLLQAIARVNRLFEGKDFGYIVDYRGVLGELNAALNTYSALADFDTADVAGMITDTAEVVAQLPEVYAAVWDIFKTVPNKQDTEALERSLEPEDRREEFYEALTAFARSLKVALATVSFYEETPERDINRYKTDFAFFHNLRVSVRQRYAETVDYREYEQKVRNLMNQHISSDGVEQITELVNIFDQEAFAAEVERIAGAAAKADTIANRVKRTLIARVDEDPVAYRRFSQLLTETIEAYRAGRLSELDYLKQAQAILAQVQQGTDRAIPAQLQRYKDARAYYGVLQQEIGVGADRPSAVGDEQMAEMAIAIERLIEARKIRDWVRNRDIHKAMMNDIEDYLFSLPALVPQLRAGTVLDQILEQVLEIAKQRDQRSPR